MPIGIIVNRVRNKSYEIKPDEIRNFSDLPVIGIVPEDEKILESTNKKTLVTISKQNSSSSRAFFEIAAKLVGAEYRRPNFFRRFIESFK